MNIRELGRYLIIPARSYEAGHHVEMKRLEWIFIGVRWLWVPLIFILAWLHHPVETPIMFYLAGGLSLFNIAATVLNIVIKKARSQNVLGIYSLAVDTLFAWGIILIFARDFYTSAYAGFVYIIIEAAIRQGLAGSIGMALLFIAGLYGTYLYREAAFGVRFSVSGYVFWCTLMTIVAVAVGTIVHEGQRRRRQSERYLRANALLTERQRIARELHDTVLKTLQGLSLEARALGTRSHIPPEELRETARYIEDVCSRTSREIREVILDLRNEDTTDGLKKILQKQLDEWSSASGIPHSFNVLGIDPFIPAETTRHLQNILAEALDNIRRHAGATAADVAISIKEGRLHMEVNDNGRGPGADITTTEQLVSVGHLGIAGMKERAGLLGGTLEIHGNGAGTTVALEIPLQNGRAGIL